MEAAHMTFEEEALKSRIELKHLRLENARLTRSNEALRKKVLKLEQENRTLRKENKLLKQQQILLLERLQQQEKQIERLHLIVEELRGMVFGKKKKKDGQDGTGTDETSSPTGKSEQAKKRKSANRSKESYRRVAPNDSDVTNVYEHSLAQCPDCGTRLIKLKQIIRYVEDLAHLTELARLLKRVEKHIIGSGYCPRCKRRKTAQALSPQVSILGENTKKLITYLIVIMRLSFEQVRCFLQDTASFQISDGEIVASLDQYADKLKPEEKRIRNRIRGAPGRHYDETGWRVQRGKPGNYCWATTPTIGEDTVFLMGESRGKGVAEELRGEGDNQVGITDDYAAYDNLFQKHQLCMAHPHRKLRDLHEAKTLTDAKQASCSVCYTSFRQLYTDVEETLQTSYQKELWLKKREEYLIRLHAIAGITENDPDKLKKIKRTLGKKAELYVTCLLQSGIPADNNKQERKLRHIVLKRNSSQGSKSDKGADTMSILCTTLLSAWWKKPKNFFVAYEQMLTA